MLPIEGSTENRIKKLEVAACGAARFYIYLKNGKQKIRALIDTGAACCIMRKDVYFELCRVQQRSTLLQHKRKLYAVNGEKRQTLGDTEIKLGGIALIPITIVANIRQEMIIGSEVLTMGKAVIDYNTQTLKLFDVQFKLETISKADIAEIKESTGYPLVDTTIEDFQHIFATAEDPIGLCTEGKCTIETNYHSPIRQRPYRMPLAKRYLVEEQIKEMLQAGVIRPSTSPWASPITLVPKKSGNEMRFCVDYRKVNNISNKDSYPLPLIQDIFDSMGGAKIFSTLDLKAGYWQIPMQENDIEKTAFVCEAGLYEFQRMPFGLTSAPSQFQRIMNKILAGYIGKFVFVYLDDIVIYSRSPEEHARHLRLVLRRIENAGLKLNPKKCDFCKKSVELLGYIVSDQGIAPQPEKTEAIVQLPPPIDVKGVRSFLGMTGYYRQCIPEYAKYAAPLVYLTKKHARFQWGSEQQAGFEYLKKALTAEPIMAYPNTNKAYKLYTDACNYAVGAILVQEDDEGIERVIHYIPHQLNDMEQKWATIEKEAYAVIYALQKLRTYLWGSDFTIYTDHKPLKSLFLQEVQNTRIQRWAVLKAEFGADIKYRPGKCHVRADMLSRIQPGHEVATFDTEEYIHPDGFPDYNCYMRIPLEADKLDKHHIEMGQKEEFPAAFQEAVTEEDSHYIISKGLLYS